MLAVVVLFLAIISQAQASVRPSGCQGKSFKQLDLLFLLDGSKTVGAVNFVKTLDFVKNVVKRLPVSADETSVGIIQFTAEGPDSTKRDGFEPRSEITLGSVHNRDQLVDKIGKIKYINGCTMTSQAIARGFLEFTKHGRQNVPKVMVVITDGKSNEAVDEVVDNVQRAGIKIISVGVGNQVLQSELLLMAGNDNSRVLSVAKFNELITYVDQLAKTIQETIDPRCYETPEVTLTPKPKGPFRHGQKIDLVCKVKSTDTKIQFLFLKDEEVIIVKSQKVAITGGFSLTHSMTVSATTEGVYQCRVRTTFGIIVSSKKVGVLKKINPDEGKPDIGTGSKDGKHFNKREVPAKQLCKRCLHHKCTLYDGQQCVKDFLNCENEQNPKGIDSCGPGRLFTVDNVRNGITGTCWSATQCHREKLLPWIRNVSG